MRARVPRRVTVRSVILLSRTRPEGLSTLVVLPRGGRILAHFNDDGSTRDVTAQAADLITEYILRGAPAAGSDGTETVEVARLEIVLESGDDGTLVPLPELDRVRMALLDLGNDLLEEIPAERLLPLLGGAIGMAVADAVAAATEGEDPEASGADKGPGAPAAGDAAEPDAEHTDGVGC